MNITKFLLRLLARDVDAIVKFFRGLEAHLEDLITKHKQDVADAEAEAKRLISVAEERAAVLIAEAEAEVKKIEDTITTKVKAAEVLFGIKSALPTA